MSHIWETAVGAAHRLATARPGFVVAALALYIVSVFIVAARWTRFLRMLGASVSVWRAALAGVAGIAVGNLVPSSRLGGEACRIALVRRSGEVTWQQATVAAVWDRLSEVPPIAVLAIMAAVAVRDLPSRWRTLALGAGVLVLLAAAAVAIRMLRRSSSGLAGWRGRLALDKLRVSVFAIGVGLSSLLWLQDVLRLTCSCLAFGVVLSPTKVAMLAVLTMIGSVVPAVAGIGPGGGQPGGRTDGLRRGPSDGGRGHRRGAARFVWFQYIDWLTRGSLARWAVPLERHPASHSIRRISLRCSIPRPRRIGRWCNRRMAAGRLW